MSEGRYLVTSEAKVNITLGLLVAVLLALLGAAWNVSGWKREFEMRVQRLEDDKCPCREFYQATPPAAQR